MLDVQIDAGPHFFFLSMYYLYVDESIDEKCFVVGGILVKNEQDLNMAYKQFKKSINSIPMTRKQKERITYEFKGNLLDRSYQQIKRKLLNKLNSFDCTIVYSSSYIMDKWDHKKREKIYIQLLDSIVKSISNDTMVISFDSFGNTAFEQNVIYEIQKNNNVKTISCDFSFNSKGLQFADNICGVIRKHLSGNDSHHYYEIIKTKVIQIDNKHVSNYP